MAITSNGQWLKWDSCAAPPPQCSTCPTLLQLPAHLCGGTCVRLQLRPQLLQLLCGTLLRIFKCVCRRRTLARCRVACRRRLCLRCVSLLASENVVTGGAAQRLLSPAQPLRQLVGGGAERGGGRRRVALPDRAVLCQRRHPLCRKPLLLRQLRRQSLAFERQRLMRARSSTS